MAQQQVQAQEAPPCLIRGFAAAIFAMASGYAPFTVEAEDDGGCVFVFPAAAKETKARYYASRDLLDALQQSAAVKRMGTLPSTAPRSQGMEK